MPVTRLITEASSSARSIEEAIQDSVLRAGAELGVESVRVKEVDVRFELGKIADYWVTLEVTYADKVEPTTTLEDDGEGSEGASQLELLRQRVLLEDLAQEELDKSGRFLDITPTEKGSGSADVSMNHDRHLPED